MEHKRIDEEHPRSNREKRIQSKLSVQIVKYIDRTKQINTCVNETAKENLGKEIRQKVREQYNKDCRNIIQRRNAVRM